jgi:drug/metabolite transporter (DMT)-like permease
MSPVLPTICLLGGVVVISTMSILARTSAVGPNATVFWRFTLSLPVLLLGLALKGQVGVCLRDLRSHAWTLTLVGAFLAAHVLFFYWGLRYTSVANACSLIGTTPIFVALGSFLCFRSRISRLTVIGIAAASCGTALLTQPCFQLTADHLLGNGLAVLAAAAAAGYLIGAERARRKLPAATVMFWSAGIVGAAVLVPALLSAEPMVPSSTSGWIHLGGFALASLLGHGLLLYSLARLPALSSALALLLEPVFAGGLALLFLGEDVIVGQAMSALLVVGGAVVGQVGQLNMVRPAPAATPRFPDLTAPAPALIGRAR